MWLRVVTMWLQSERRVRIAFLSRNHLPTGALPGDAARFVTHAVTNTLSSITHAHGHQRSSAVIGGHQRSSAVITCSALLSLM